MQLSPDDTTIDEVTTDVDGLLRLYLDVRYAPELPERLLRVLRHRGARLEEFHLVRTGDATGTVDLAVRPAGTPQLLVAQIRRLADVRHAHAQAPQELLSRG